jgi:hypothetical protein
MQEMRLMHLIAANQLEPASVRAGMVTLNNLKQPHKLQQD